MPAPTLPYGGSRKFVDTQRRTGCAPLRLIPSRQLILALALCPFSHTLPAQESFYDPEYTASVWQTEQGLPENSATSMIQTPEGYLIFGTFHGIVRFDGVKFTLFHQPQSKALPDLGIVKLYLSRSGDLWVGTLEGIALHRAGTWKHYGSAQGWKGSPVRYFAEAGDGTLYLSTFDHHIYRFNGEVFEALPSPPGRSNPTMVFDDPQGHIHAVNRDSFNTWTGSAWTSAPMPQEISVSTDVPSWGLSKEGLLWAYSGRRLSLLDHGRIMRRIVVNGNPTSTWNLTEDAQGQVWICSYRDGLFRVSPDGSVRHFDTSTGLPSNSVRFVFPDRQGNLWVGSDGGGLVRFRTRRFISIGRENGLPSFPVKAVAAHPDGRTLLATFGDGVYSFHDGHLSPLPVPGQPPYAQSLLIDSHRRIWVGSFGRGLFLLNGDDRPSSPFPAAKGASIESLFEDSRSRVWIASSPGNVAMYDAGRFTHMALDRVSGGVPVRCFAEDPISGAIWAGGDAGLFRLQKDRFTAVLDSAGRQLPPITFIHPDGPNSLWVATATSGLLHWSNGSISVLKDDTLPFGTTGGMLEDGDHIWFATNRGVFRIHRAGLRAALSGDTQKLEWQQFDRGDGLPSIECSIGHQPSIGRDSFGRIWVSTLRGAAMIDPRRLTPDTNEVPIFFDEVNYFTKAGAPERLRVVRNPSIRIPAGSVNLQVSYSALEYAHPDKILLSYTLERDGKTVASGFRSSREISFPLLESGDYRLSIRARNADGLWGKNTRELKFALESYFWNTAAFRFSLALLAAFAMVMGTLSISRFRSRLVMDRLAREKERAELESRLLQAGKMESIGRLAGGVAHDFNNLLTVVNGSSRLLLDELPAGSPHRSRVEGILNAGQRAADLTRKLLGFSRKQAVSTKPLQINILVRDFTAVLQRLVGERVHIHLDLDDSLTLVDADPALIDQLIMNLVVNARDAMPAGGAITIRTSNLVLSPEDCVNRPDAAPGNWVLLSVSDTGAGMDDDTRSRIFEPFFTTKSTGEGTGMGLSIVYGAVKQSGGWIEVESSPGKGSAFHIFLPGLHSPAIRQDFHHAVRSHESLGTVLLVEDQPDVRRLTAEILRMGGYNVLQAGGGAEALDLASSHGDSIRLLLSDIVMPGLTGYEVADRITRLIPKLKVIFLSAYPSEPHHPSDAAVLRKPFDPASLLQHVRSTLAGEPPAKAH